MILRSGGLGRFNADEIPCHLTATLGKAAAASDMASDIALAPDANSGYHRQTDARRFKR